jgi:hypothetical protein
MVREAVNEVLLSLNHHLARRPFLPVVRLQASLLDDERAVGDQIQTRVGADCDLVGRRLRSAQVRLKAQPCAFMSVITRLLG